MEPAADVGTVGENASVGREVSDLDVEEFDLGRGGGRDRDVVDSGASGVVKQRAHAGSRCWAGISRVSARSRNT